MGKVSIIYDEREHTQLGICEECGEEKQIRPVESFGSMGESRGFYKFCFDCFAPRVKWRDRHGREFWLATDKVRK